MQNHKYVGKKCRVIMPDGAYSATISEYNLVEECYVIKLDDHVFSMKVNKPTVEYRNHNYQHRAEFYAC